MKKKPQLIHSKPLPVPSLIIFALLFLGTCALLPSPCHASVDSPRHIPTDDFTTAAAAARHPLTHVRRWDFIKLIGSAFSNAVNGFVTNVKDTYASLNAQRKKKATEKEEEFKKEEDKAKNFLQQLDEINKLAEDTANTANITANANLGGDGKSLEEFFKEKGLTVEGLHSGTADILADLNSVMEKYKKSVDNGGARNEAIEADIAKRVQALGAAVEAHIASLRSRISYQLKKTLEEDKNGSLGVFTAYLKGLSDKFSKSQKALSAWINTQLAGVANAHDNHMSALQKELDEDKAEMHSSIDDLIAALADELKLDENHPLMKLLNGLKAEFDRLAKGLEDSFNKALEYTVSMMAAEKSRLDDKQQKIIEHASHTVQLHREQLESKRQALDAFVSGLRSMLDDISEKTGDEAVQGKDQLESLHKTLLGNLNSVTERINDDDIHKIDSLMEKLDKLDEFMDKQQRLHATHSKLNMVNVHLAQEVKAVDRYEKVKKVGLALAVSLPVILMLYNLSLKSI
eukprot:Nk52_evm6s649 gene=Nk52_evmTU6s649